MSDDLAFDDAAIARLTLAAEEAAWLIGRGYPLHVDESCARDLATRIAERAKAAKAKAEVALVPSTAKAPR